MIRSLVLVPSTEPELVIGPMPAVIVDETGDDAMLPEKIIATPFTLRRNLSRDSLETVLAEGCSMWIDIVNPEKDEILWVEKWLHLSPKVIEDVLREDRRPTLVVYPRYLFLSLFQPNVPNNGNAIVGREIHCLLGEHFFITVRQAEATAVEIAYDRVAQNLDSWKRGNAYFLYLTAQHVIDTYYPLLDRISNQINQLEEKLLADTGGKQAQKTIYRIKQHLIGLRQMIAPQREVLSNMIGEQRLSQNSDIQDLFHHLYERLLGIYDVIDVQRDLTSNVLDIIANQQSRKMGDAINRLTIISMVFLPFTFFLGLFDSNLFTVKHSLVLPINGLAMFILILVTMSASVGLTLMIFRWRKWA